MPLMLPDDQLVLTAAPGTGSTSLAAAVAALPGVVAVPEHDLTDGDPAGGGRTVVDAKHATVAQLIAAELLPADHGLRIVTTTRNPFDFYPAEWDRTRGRWVQLLRDRTSWVHTQAGAIDRIVDAVTNDFDDWLQLVLGDDHTAGRTRRLNRGHVTEAHEVLRMEHLQGDADRCFGPGRVAVGHLNRTGRSRPYWQYYSARSRQLVEDVHRPDLEAGHYRF